MMNSSDDRVVSESWRERTIDELAREQGVKPAKDLRDFYAPARELWESDEDFEQFLTGIRDRRHEASQR